MIPLNYTQKAELLLTACLKPGATLDAGTKESFLLLGAEVLKLRDSEERLTKALRLSNAALGEAHEVLEEVDSWGDKEQDALNAGTAALKLTKHVN